MDIKWNSVQQISSWPMLSENINTIKKKAGVRLQVSRELGLQVNRKKSVSPPECRKKS
jgi:hypothetical protein